MLKSGLKVSDYVHDFEGFGNRLYLEMENGDKNMVDNEEDYRKWRESYATGIKDLVDEDKKIQLSIIESAK